MPCDGEITAGKYDCDVDNDTLAQVQIPIRSPLTPFVALEERNHYASDQQQQIPGNADQQPPTSSAHLQEQIVPPRCGWQLNTELYFRQVCQLLETAFNDEVQKCHVSKHFATDWKTWILMFT